MHVQIPMGLRLSQRWQRGLRFHRKVERHYPREVRDGDRPTLAQERLRSLRNGALYENGRPKSRGTI